VCADTALVGGGGVDNLGSAAARRWIKISAASARRRRKDVYSFLTKIF